MPQPVLMAGAKDLSSKTGRRAAAVLAVVLLSAPVTTAPAAVAAADPPTSTAACGCVATVRWTAVTVVTVEFRPRPELVRLTRVSRLSVVVMEVTSDGPQLTPGGAALRIGAH
ncbi:hypothetical protein Q5425_07575 [Amycolatopsis sp. A133]|uniref:hypothetical protein n=1 Tax=Amycolatopsis sp. A133 TaxID=3064472 RepID=UPI0027EB5081|nr:hypothetical protein [Amycolatopsis sp. A133]MDQ7803585.1 hypothetical protein [Amycolatopsis sp. A133]